MDDPKEPMVPRRELEECQEEANAQPKVETEPPADTLVEARRRNMAKASKKSGGSKKQASKRQQAEQPKGQNREQKQAERQQKLQKRAEEKTQEVEARQRRDQEAFAPDTKLKDVAVAVKQTERAAKAEQQRIDAGKEAAKGQQPFRPASAPGDEGFEPEPMHPPKPSPRGSAPRSDGTPEGPMGEDVIYRTDDIAEDGTPLIQPDFVEQTPEYDGEALVEYTAKRGLERWQHQPAEPVQDEERINAHSPEGARLDEIKEGRPVRYVPNDFTLDPTTGNPNA